MEQVLRFARTTSWAEVARNEVRSQAKRIGAQRKLVRKRRDAGVAQKVLELLKGVSEQGAPWEMQARDEGEGALQVEESHQDA